MATSSSALTTERPFLSSINGITQIEFFFITLAVGQGDKQCSTLSLCEQQLLASYTFTPIFRRTHENMQFFPLTGGRKQLPRLLNIGE